MEENLTCGTCSYLDDQHCPILNKHIYAINLNHIDITCTPEKRERALERYSINAQQKYPRLESVFAALGYIFDNRYHDKTRKKPNL